MERNRPISAVPGFNPEIASRPQLVVANKCDLASSEQIEEFRQFVQEQGRSFFAISAATSQGIRELVYAVWQELEKLPPVKIYEAEPAPLYEVHEEDRTNFQIKVEDGIYIVEAPWLAQVLGSVNMDDYESLQYFQRVLRSSGIIDKLLEMGIQEGDTVSIFNFQFDYIN